jgi:hypothetical protein
MHQPLWLVSVYGRARRGQDIWNRTRFIEYFRTRTRLIKIVRPGPATSLHAEFSRNFFFVFTSGGRSKN